MPSLQLSIQKLSAIGIPVRATLKRWVLAALERDAALTLRFVDTREGRRLNREFRRKDYATDILTFPYSTQPIVIADIVVCLPAVQREARLRGRPPREHLAHLIVHATLHAHGYHHGSTRDARAMEKREVQVMKALGKPDPYG
ncbi:MAG: rRNA maturation RNase YbeY [Burkholderiaceae bacterium]|nr:rRNA maturation RNase YbeY [Burkholderiaceae bacterium]